MMDIDKRNLDGRYKEALELITKLTDENYELRKKDEELVNSNLELIKLYNKQQREMIRRTLICREQNQSTM